MRMSSKRKNIDGLGLVSTSNINIFILMRFQADPIGAKQKNAN